MSNKEEEIIKTENKNENDEKEEKEENKDIVKIENKNQKDEIEETMENQVLLSINNLSISVQQGNVPLVSSFNMQVKAGDRLGISAPTGTGKTTLLNLIAGIIPQAQSQEEKRFSIQGDIKKIENLKICYAFQEPRLIPSVSILKNLILPLENIMPASEGMELACEWLKKLNLYEKKDMLPGLLSGGERQRAGLARAFAWAQACRDFPHLFLFDEPFASQDEQNIQNISSLIMEQNQSGNSAFIIISHDKNLLCKICNSVIIDL